jgi:hypothetical protein
MPVNGKALCHQSGAALTQDDGGNLNNFSCLVSVNAKS